MLEAFVVIGLLLAVGIGAVLFVVYCERVVRLGQSRGRVRVDALIDQNRAKPRPGMDRRDDRLLTEMATRGRRAAITLAHRSPEDDAGRDLYMPPGGPSR